MADRGLRATAVPSARAGQQTDPAARRDALTGLMTGGFLLAVVAVALSIVIAAPQYAVPVADAAVIPDAGEDPSPEVATLADAAEQEVMTSPRPSKLKGYRWPVRGGSLHSFYGRDRAGRFVIGDQRIHDGIVITWFEGAPVKAAHAGTVVAVGKDWIRHAGYEGDVDEAVARFERRARKEAKKTGKEPVTFPQGVVIDDGNGYYSIYTEIKDISVRPDDVVKAGRTIGTMSRAEGKQMMRYRLVRMDGPKMKVHQGDRKLLYPGYARERIDPLAVLKLDAKRKPLIKRKPPKDTPHLSDY